MTDAPSITKPRLIVAEPQLFVADIDAACADYVAKLGFKIMFTWGDPPFYAQVARDGARLNLRSLDAPAIDPALRDAEGLLAATIVVNDAQALFDEFQIAGADIARPLQRENWGAETFIVRDRDGNLILFAS